MKSYISNFSDENFYFNQSIYFEKFQIDLLEKTRKKIKDEFESIDLLLRNDRRRIQYGWQIKDYRIRKIKTIYGDIEILRTRYINKFTNEVKALVDEQIPLEKYQRILPHLKIEILNRVGKGNRYCDIVDALRDSKISEQTVSNIVKRFNISKETIEDLDVDKIDVSQREFIYIETDDTFPNLIINNQKMQCRVRLTTIHTGVKKGMYGRNYLENKKTDYLLMKSGSRISTYDFSQKIIKFIDKHYKNWSDKKIIVLGDNASWILNLAQHIGGEYVLDKFHLVKKLGSVFPSGVSRYKTIWKWSKHFWYLRDVMMNGISYENIMEAMAEVFYDLENKGEDIKLKEYFKFVNFVKKNHLAIKNYYKNFNSSSHTEGQISSFVKQTLGYGKKIYSFKTFDNLLKIKQIKANGYDFCELLEYEIETLQLKNVEYNFKQVREFNSVGRNKVNKSPNKVSNGHWARVKQPGYKLIPN